MEKSTKDTLAQRIVDTLSENNGLGRSLMMAEDALAAQKVFVDNGIEITLEEVNSIFNDGVDEILKLKTSSANGELSEKQLDDVAGGGFWRGTFRTVASMAAGFGFGCLCGICPAASAATPYVAGGLAVWSTAGYLK